MIDYFKKKISQRTEDELLYEYVMEEMEEEPNFIKGLWGKAIAHAEGNTDKAKSLYMQYRVQSIKDDFKLLKIAYHELSKEKLWDTIKNGFSSDEEKQKIKKEQQEKQEEKKYEKIRGWLIFFAILIVLNDLSLITISKYFSNEFNLNFQIMHITNQSLMLDYISIVFYFNLISIFMLILLTITFFSKSRFTKKVIKWFSIIIILQIIFLSPNLYGLSDINSTNINLDLIKKVWSLLWVAILLLYFMYSMRAKKTFVKRAYKLKVYIGLSLIIPVLLGVNYKSNIKELSQSYNLQGVAWKLGNENFDKSDYDNAIYFYKRTLNYRDSAGVMRNLGLSYGRMGRYEESQIWYKKAFDTYIKQAEYGDKESAKRLAEMYQDGIGVAKDSKKAKYWENKAKYGE